MRKITIYSEWSGDFTFSSDLTRRSYPNMTLRISQNCDDRTTREICAIEIHPYFNGYDDCRRRLYVDRGCKLYTEIRVDKHIYPLNARIVAGADYFGLLRFLWHFCDCDDNFDELVKWLNETIDLALNGIF